MTLVCHTSGQLIRVAGLLTLLQEALLGVDNINYSLVPVVTAEDYVCVIHILQYAQEITAALMGTTDSNPQ